MLEFTIRYDEAQNPYLETETSGKALLTIPQLNKGTAFTEEERHVFGLIGKLPSRIETLEEQVDRAYQQYLSYNEQLNRNVYLNQLLNTNQILFYKLVQKHIQEMLPTIYTPIVGNAVTSYNKKFSQPRGLYISYPDRHHIMEILDNRTNPDIKLIVVSDGEGVLGIGDQGVGAMAIPVAKLMVYSAMGGIDPLNTLPIMLDAGTNNETLLNDPLYLGWRHPRLTGDEYSEFIDLFVQAVQKKFPHVFLHWEDFGRTNAYRNLVKYRNKLCSFNDDIQGTGTVACAALLSAVYHSKVPLIEQRIVVFGAGTAGMGITDSLCQAMVRGGLSLEEARKHFWLVDRQGLLTELCEGITEAQTPYVRSKTELDSWNVDSKSNIELYDVIKEVKPTVLIGCSARAGAFTETIIREMAAHIEHPLVMPLSNPTEKAEATPTDIIEWTEGRAFIASGSPFPNVIFRGTEYPISQCNNYLCFPGIGFGLIAVKAKQLTDDMLWKASEVLGTFVDPSSNRLLPSLEQVSAASRAIAIAIAEDAIKNNLADFIPEGSVADWIDQQYWTPQYMPYKKAK